ncbi:MAG: hypothetical protein QQN63_04950 [Nitrosopumilus sp.]
MNLKTAAALILDDLTTISCVFMSQSSSRHGNEISSKEYIYKVLKSLAENLKPGDQVLVKRREGIGAVTVVDIHEEPRLDVDAGYDYEWAFQKVDLDLWGKLNTRDVNLLGKIKEAQNKNTRQSLLAQLGISDPTALLESINKEEE